MSQREGVLAEAIMDVQDPPAASRFDAVDCVAGNHLKGLEDESFGKCAHNAANARARSDEVVQTLNIYPRRSPRNLNDITPEGFSGGEFAHEAERGLPAEHRNFDRDSVFENVDKRHAGILGKICMMDRLARFIEDPAME